MEYPAYSHPNMNPNMHNIKALKIKGEVLADGKSVLEKTNQ